MRRDAATLLWGQGSETQSRAFIGEGLRKKVKDVSSFVVIGRLDDWLKDGCAFVKTNHTKSSC